MARDFASRQHKRSQPAAQDAPRTRSRGAVPRPPEPEASPAPQDFWSRLPGWSWLAIGLVAGFALAQLTRPEAPTPLQAAAPEVPAAVVTEPPASRPAETTTTPAQPRFDFYTLLPESEVVAPRVDAYQSTPREAESLPRFMLQVGSFRMAEDAARLEARLKSLGFDRIRITPVETGTGDVWHRVQVGPYQDRRLLARAQDNLARAGLEFMLLRLRDEPEAQPAATLP